MNDNLPPGVTDKDIDAWIGDDVPVDIDDIDMDDDSDLLDIIV